MERDREAKEKSDDREKEKIGGGSKRKQEAES